MKIRKRDVYPVKVWELVSHERSFSFNLVNFDEDKNQLYSTDQGIDLTDWKPFKMEISKKGIKSDLPHFYPGVLVFSQKSIQTLDNYIENYVQYLTIEGVNEYVLANVVNLVDCVDYELSTSYKNRLGGFAGFKEVKFIKEKVENEYLFKIKGARNTVYVTDLFRDIVLASKLTGYDFIEVWDSEVTEDIEQQRQENYERKLAEIEQNKGKEISWSEAVNLVNDGKSAASGKWKIQNNKTGSLLLGELTGDLTYDYDWMDPMFLPPILFSLKWHEVENSAI